MKSNCKRLHWLWWLGRCYSDFC